MRIEEIRDKFIKNENVFCDVCQSEIIVTGDRDSGIIVSAECSKNSSHYAVTLNIGRNQSIAEMFKDSPQRKAA